MRYVTQSGKAIKQDYVYGDSTIIIDSTHKYDATINFVKNIMKYYLNGTILPVGLYQPVGFYCLGWWVLFYFITNKMWLAYVLHHFNINITCYKLRAYIVYCSLNSLTSKVIRLWLDEGSELADKIDSLSNTIGTYSTVNIIFTKLTC